MSDQIYVWIAVTATFAAAVLVARRVIVGGQARRATTVLQGHLETAGIDVTNRPTDSFSDRVVSPAMAKVSSVAARFTPSGARDEVAHRLILAGEPRGVTAELFVAL